MFAFGVMPVQQVVKDRLKGNHILQLSDHIILILVMSKLNSGLHYLMPFHQTMHYSSDIVDSMSDIVDLAVQCGMSLELFLEKVRGVVA